MTRNKESNKVRIYKMWLIGALDIISVVLIFRQMLVSGEVLLAFPIFTLLIFLILYILFDLDRNSA